MEFLEVNSIKKIFNEGEDNEARGLLDINLNIYKEDFVVISGPSGSGKSTLLNIIGGLDSPTSGEIILEGDTLTSFKESDLAEYRRDNIGFIFQAYNLIPVLSVKENIEYVMRLQGKSQKECEQRVQELAKELDISELLHKLPDHLSGGQQQRVAVARAVASKPKLILADEPTANLDSINSDKLMELMRKLNEHEKITIIFSSHDPSVVNKAKRLISLKDGTIIKDSKK